MNERDWTYSKPSTFHNHILQAVFPGIESNAEYSIDEEFDLKEAVRTKSLQDKGSQDRVDW